MEVLAGRTRQMTHYLPLSISLHEDTQHLRSRHILVSAVQTLQSVLVELFESIILIDITNENVPGPRTSPDRCLSNSEYTCCDTRRSRPLSPSSHGAIQFCNASNIHRPRGTSERSIVVFHPCIFRKLKRGNSCAKLLCRRHSLQLGGGAFLPPQCLLSRLGPEIEESPHAVANFEGSCTSVGSTEVPRVDVE